MEIRVLKYFLAVAQEENITRAAERLHVSQPTIVRQLRQPEKLSASRRNLPAPAGG